MVMKKQAKFVRDLVNWPFRFSIIEILVVLIGLLIGHFLYQQTNKIREESSSARLFEQQTRSLIIAISEANIKFTSLLDGNSEISLQGDVYSQLDIAEDLCVNFDDVIGQPPPSLTLPINQVGAPSSVCDQVANFRSIMQIRWANFISGKNDSRRGEYDDAFDQLLQTLLWYNDANDPRLKETDQKTNFTNAGISVGMALIFTVLALIVRGTRISLTRKNKQLVDEVELRNKLFQDLNAERNLINTLIDNVPDAVFAKDLQDKYLIANPAEAYAIGAAFKEDLIGKSEEDYQPAAVARRIRDENSNIFATGEPLREKQATVVNPQTGQLRWRQTTKVPLRNEQGQIIGLLGISRDITAQKEIEEALTRANDQLTEGIAALELSSKETERISAMVDLLQACPNTEEACKVIADQMGHFFPEDSGLLYLYHSSRNILDRATLWGEPLDDPLVFKPDECWGLRRGRMHIVDESAISSGKEADHSLICGHIKPSGPADYLCVPLVAQGEAIGLMHLCHPVTEHSSKEWYDHQKRQRIHTIIDSLSLALANLKLRSTLREQTIRDPLTNMFNRRYMEETLEREILRAKRKEDSIGVIMLDIDHFKLFNDNFGHQAGDALLSALGNFLRTHVRGEDVACRYGGEEFILVMPGAKLEPTQKRAQDLIENVKYLTVSHQGRSLGTITFSAGVAVFPENGMTAESLVQCADQALYRAKQEGRDRVVTAV
jgi:diguanylate cyclase (GGDEF)-like protein/PAS domain S-box-containing protein